LATNKTKWFEIWSKQKVLFKWNFYNLLPNLVKRSEEALASIGLHHSPDGITNPKYKLQCFITTKFLCKEKNALAFNRDRCCHLALCLQLIPFHCVHFAWTKVNKMKWRVHLCSKNILLPTRTYFTKTFADSFAKFSRIFWSFSSATWYFWDLSKLSKISWNFITFNKILKYNPLISSNFVVFH